MSSPYKINYTQFRYQYFVRKITREISFKFFVAKYDAQNIHACRMVPSHIVVARLNAGDAAWVDAGDFLDYRC
jgi:hypothetical protein